MKAVLIVLLVLSGCVSSQIKKGFLKDDVDLTKEKSDLYFSIGRNYEDHERLEDAIKNYQEAIKIDFNNSQAHFYLGKLLLEKGFIHEGVAQVEKAVLVNLRYTEARNFLANLNYTKLKNYKKAKALVDESVKDLTYQNQEESWSLKLKLDHQFLSGRALKETLRKTLALKPKVCKHRLDIAHTLYKMSLYESALKSARMVDGLCFKLKEKNKAALLKGLIFIKKNDYLVAEQILRNISFKDEKFHKMLNRVKTAVRKKINLGI